MRIALVHDYLVQYGGAERTLEVLHSIFPRAPIFTSIYKPNAMPSMMKEWDIRVSFLQRTVFSAKWHRIALPLYPLAFEIMNLKGFDIILSSSSAFAKGVIPNSCSEHICYLHSPMRFAWDADEYLTTERIAAPVRPVLECILHKMRIWDVSSSHRVDRFISNSKEVQARAMRYYRRESEVIYPPVNAGDYCVRSEHENYYLIVSRFVPYKRIDLALEALKEMDLACYVVGGGRQKRDLEKIAGPKTVFTGRVSEDSLRKLISGAKALIVPGKEDFGIAALEANAAGVPVIAYAAGGSLETQEEGVTGVFFWEPTVESLCDAIRRLDGMILNPMRIHLHSMRFDKEVFVRKIKSIVSETATDMACRHIPCDPPVGA
jgi:glycosyltransferase involved in cell wall biosynthesis